VTVKLLVPFTEYGATEITEDTEKRHEMAEFSHSLSELCVLGGNAFK
jgi:hypothetical protein